jgi:hypothetical protein
MRAYLACGTGVAYAGAAMRPSALALLGMLVAASPARADVWTDLAGDERAVTTLDAARAQVDGHRVALEAQSQELAAQIEKLKSQPAGIRRDRKLQELLAAQKATSDELERVAGDLRGRASLLAGARKKLIADCDRALVGQLPEAKRLELARLRTAQAAWLALPDRPLGVARANADPLDGPRELQDKADLLRDSEDKLRREVKRLAQRIDNVERRRHLRERAGAVDEDLFGEAASNRRVRIQSTVEASGNTGGGAQTPTAHGGPSAGAGGGGAGSNGLGGQTGGAGGGGGGGGFGGGGTPSPGANGPTGGAGNPSPGSGGVTSPGGPGNPPSTPGSTGGSDTATVLRNLVDPATLDELRRSGDGDDLERQLRALRRAQTELQGLANELDQRARSLSTRADELKHKK